MRRKTYLPSWSLLVVVLLSGAIVNAVLGYEVRGYATLFGAAAGGLAWITLEELIAYFYRKTGRH